MQNTNHIFTTSGIYIVKLKVFDAIGCTDSTTASITTTSIADIDFNYKQDICNPLSIQFFNIGNPPLNPKWLFGDGGSIAGNQSPTYTYSNSGTYTVKYSTQNSACADTIVKVITIGLQKANIILTNDTTICYGATKQLISAPGLNFCWAPVTYLDNPQSASPFTSTPGKITYFLTAEIPGKNVIVNGDFTDGNTGFTSEYNFANPNTTEAEYFVGVDPQTWNGLLSPCRDHTTGSGNMMLINGAPIPDINVWKQTVVVVPNTNYEFSTWVQSLYPPNPAQLSFSINGGTLGNLITADATNCNWTQFYTTWNSGSSATATISIVNKNTFVQGNDFALDDISFSPVLVKTDSIVISVDTPFVKTIADTAVCSGDKVQLLAIGAASYNWSPASAVSNAAISNPIANTTNTTQFIVTGITSKGCTASDTVVVTAKQLPVVNASSDTIVCKGKNVQLSASGGVAYPVVACTGT